MAEPIPREILLEVRDRCLCFRAQRAARALARRFDLALRPFGLTNGQFSLMMALNRPEPWTMSALAEFLAMDRTSLTAAVKTLTRRGLVATSADKKDARVRRLELTGEGQARLAAAVPVWRATHDAVDAALAELSPEEMRAALAALLAAAR